MRGTVRTVADLNEHILFPAGLVDRRGRRIRPGSLVTDEGVGPVLEVTGFQAGRLLVIDAEAGVMRSVAYQSCERFDDDTRPRLTAGSFVVEYEPDDRPTTLVVPVGNRDLSVDDLGWRDDLERSHRTRLPVPVGPEDFRAWSRALRSFLESLESTEALHWCRSHLRAPILDRVLAEAALPSELDRLVLVVTDQTTPHPNDTVDAAAVLSLYLEATGRVYGRGQVSTGRWIRSVSTVVVRNMPHFLDTVLFDLDREIPAWFDGGARVAVVQAGGTPAVNTAILVGSMMFATERGLAPRSVRHIQIPDVAGDGSVQPPIEMDVDDLTWARRLVASDDTEG